MGFHIPTDVLIIVWTVVAATVLLMAVFARLYRKAGPNEALVVYGIRGPASSRATARSSCPWSKTAASCRWS